MPITTLPLAPLLGSIDAEHFAGRRKLAEVSGCIVKARRVVVVSGAGISCSSGIPVSGSLDVQTARHSYAWGPVVDV